MQIATKKYGAIDKDGAHESKNLVEEGRMPGRIDQKPYRQCGHADAGKGHSNVMTCFNERKLGESLQKYT
ncbi:MAG: hypothetical protein V1796_02335 [Pseudomonadota bacterium]